MKHTVFALKKYFQSHFENYLIAKAIPLSHRNNEFSSLGGGTVGFSSSFCIQLGNPFRLWKGSFSISLSKRNH